MLSAVIVVGRKKERKPTSNRLLTSQTAGLIISAESQQTASHICIFYPITDLPGVVASIKKISFVKETVQLFSHLFTKLEEKN